MAKTAFLFPGQGSQHVGMGRDLCERFPEARARFDEADEVLGFKLTRWMFGEGDDEADDEDALRQTDVTQPALYVHSLAAAAVLEGRGLAPDGAAGHSLGEYSALAATGALTYADGLRLVRLRGILMAEAGRRRPGTMAAVLGLDDEAVVAVCDQASAQGEGVVQAANFNAPGQVVISGDEAAVARASEALKAQSARRVVPLPVSGAFHSPLMEEARDGLREALLALDVRVPRCPVYLNVTAAPTLDPETIRKRLLEQLTAPVRWSETLRQMRQGGAARFVEVGTGNVLTGLVRRTLGRDVETATAGTAEEVLGFES